MEVVSTRLEPEFQKFLEEIAKKNQLTVSEVLRGIILYYIEQSTEEVKGSFERSPIYYFK